MGLLSTASLATLLFASATSTTLASEPLAAPDSYSSPVPASVAESLAPAVESPPPVMPPLCLGEVCFDRHARIGEAWVPLRGAAVLRYMGFRVYDGALYMPADANPSPESLGKVPMRLTLHYLRTIKREDIITASEKAIAANPANDMKTLRPALDKLYACFQSVKKGDRYELTYIPGSGSVLLFNGEEQCRIEGEAFARAYLGIWLSDHAINETFKRRLLGLGRE